MTTRISGEQTRRDVLKKGVVGAGILVLGSSVGVGSAAAQKPDFSPRIWGDGEQWGTKVTGIIKNPNENSLDKFFVITADHDHPPDSDAPAGHSHSLPDGQLPVSEAAPGNPAYNGGRWWTHTATWTHEGFVDHGGSVPLLTRYGPADDPESILFHENLDHIEITAGSPAGGPPDYFRCPMLPVIEE